MRQTPNKLVRDLIPTIIERSGNKCKTRRLSEAEYIKALRLKLIEESEEVAEASLDEIVIEIADVYEVIESLIVALDLDINEIKQQQQLRRQQRGGFSQRIQLVWTEKQS